MFDSEIPILKTLDDYYRIFSSDCTAGSANQLLAKFDAPALHTGRIAYRLSHGGRYYSLLFSNQVDSTFSDGSVSAANDIGGSWEILGVRVGLSPSWEAEPDCWFPVTFGGSTARVVSDPEPFFTDPVELNAEGGEYLCYEMTLRGSCFPYHEEMVLNVRKKQPDGSWIPDKRIPAPLMIGSDRPVSQRIGFIGDSITQGCGTVSESYTHWVAKIAEGLPESVSVWDLGIGFARGYDAATDGGWLNRAKRCDAVNVCFGVNDLLRGRTAEQVIGDLDVIVSALNQAGCRTVLFTVPPFDMSGDPMRYWYQVNEAIRGELGGKADRIFDFAAVLGQEAPNAHRSVYGGHPNAQGCRIAAEAYLRANPLSL